MVSAFIGFPILENVWCSCIPYMLNTFLGFVKNVFLFIYNFTSKYILVFISLVFVELIDQLPNIKLIEMFSFENINSHCTQTQ